MRYKHPPAISLNLEPYSCPEFTQLKESVTLRESNVYSDKLLGLYVDQTDFIKINKNFQTLNVFWEVVNPDRKGFNRFVCSLNVNISNQHLYFSQINELIKNANSNQILELIVKEIPHLYWKDLLFYASS